MNKRLHIGALVWLSTLMTLMMACKQQSTEQQTTKEKQDDRIFVSLKQFEGNQMALISPVAMDFPTTIPVNGMVDVPPQNKAIITAIMGGYVKGIPFMRGQQVQKGQPILYIENQDFVKLQQQYLEAKQQLNYIKTEYDRQKLLAAEKISSEKNLLKAQSDYNSLLAQMSGLQKQLQMININPASLSFNNITSVVALSSPITGNIADIMVEQGMYVAPTSPLIKVINNEQLHLVLSVFEKDIPKLKVGDKVEFTMPEVSEETYHGTVKLIAQNIDEKRTTQVNVAIEDKSGPSQLVAGMFVSAQIITSSSSGFGLSEAAVAETQHGNYALILDEKNDKGYYFKKVEIAHIENYNGFVKLTGHDTGSFLKGKVFDLID